MGCARRRYEGERWAGEGHLGVLALELLLQELDLDGGRVALELEHLQQLPLCAVHHQRLSWRLCLRSGSVQLSLCITSWKTLSVA